MFVALGSYLYAKVDQVRGETKVSVYLKDDALNRQIGTLEVRLRQNPDVKTVVYISKAQALAKMKKQLGNDNNVFKQLPVNPLPASLEVHLHDPGQAKAVAATVRGQAGRRLRSTTAARPPIACCAWGPRSRRWSAA